MLKIYTSPSCSSCKKVKEYFKSHDIAYKERNILKMPLSRQEIFKMLSNSENGFDDIISTRSKVFKECGKSLDDMKVSELVDFIIEHPSVLKRPIILTDMDLQVGYNDEDITLFLPPDFREQACDHCYERAGAHCFFDEAIHAVK